MHIPNKLNSIRGNSNTASASNQFGKNKEQSSFMKYGFMCLWLFFCIFAPFDGVHMAPSRA